MLGHSHEPNAPEQQEIHMVETATKPYLYAKYCSATGITYAVSP